jgi:protein-disulfide isomerase
MNRAIFPALAAILLFGCTMPVQGPVTEEIEFDTGGSSQAMGAESDVQESTSTGSVRIDERLLPSGIVELGNPNAPVSILLFTNHSCTYCRAFYADLILQLRENYLRTNSVRIGIAHFTLNKYPDSDQSAALLLCAARQGKGLVMHDLLLQQGIGSNTYRISLTNLGMDQTELESCIEEEGVQATIEAQQSMARSLGVFLVPTYFVNGEKHVGLPEFADLKGQIEEALRTTK